MILLVDNDAVSARVWSHLLGRMRYVVTVVSSGAAALEVVANTPVDLIVCAIDLPDINGLDLIDRLVEALYLADVPIIVCTGNADAATVNRARQLGVADFLLKPIRADRLLLRLERTLRSMPVRWEPRSEVLRRLQVTTAEAHSLVAMAQQEVVALVDALGAAEEMLSATEPGQPLDLAALGGHVERARCAALTVGAVHCASLIARLWHPELSLERLQRFRQAMRVESRSFEPVLLRTPAARPDDVSRCA